MAMKGELMKRNLLRAVCVAIEQYAKLGCASVYGVQLRLELLPILTLKKKVGQKRKAESRG